MPSKVEDKVIYQFPNFNGAAVEVWELINKFIPDFIIGVIIHSRCDNS